MSKLLALLVVLSLVATVVLNGLSNGTLVPGRTIGGVSNTYDTLFAPAGLTFAIWGVIYLALTAFVVYQAIQVFGGNVPVWHSGVGWLFVLSCVLNIAWLFAWLYGYLGLALLLMLGLLGSLLGIYLMLGTVQATAAERYLVVLPFSIYLAWICVATIANVAAWLSVGGWTGWGLSAYVWTDVMVVVAALLGVALVWLRRDAAVGLVVMWALLGIWLKHADNGMVAAASLRTLTLAGIALCGVGIMAMLIWGRRVLPG
ncbi:MAG: hypothetical protein OHK0039_03790 [Bacteroidia bacterium]